MPRFFVKDQNCGEGNVEILGQDAFHIARTLRMAVGDEITVCDQKGMTYQVVLKEIRDERVVGEILTATEGDSESPVEIHLFCAWPKGDKAETVVQKAVELGAATVTFFSSERCIKHPKDDKLPRQIARLQKIAEEAAKQSGRSRLPEICYPLSFAEMISKAKATDLPLFCYEGEDACSLKEAILGKTPISAAIVVGAEGGFSPAEAQEAKNAGLCSVHLGKRILRCETAPLVALSALLFAFEL